MKYNIKNWKWWVFLPIAIVWTGIALIPLSLVWLLGVLLAVANYLNFGSKPCKTLNKVVNWIDK